MRIVPMQGLKSTTKREAHDFNRAKGQYEKAVNNIIEAKIIVEGLKDIREGRVIDGEKAVERIRKKYSI